MSKLLEVVTIRLSVEVQDRDQFKPVPWPVNRTRIVHAKIRHDVYKKYTRQVGDASTTTKETNWNIKMKKPFRISFFI